MCVDVTRFHDGNTIEIQPNCWQRTQRLQILYWIIVFVQHKNTPNDRDKKKTTCKSIFESNVHEIGMHLKMFCVWGASSYHHYHRHPTANKWRETFFSRSNKKPLGSCVFKREWIFHFTRNANNQILKTANSMEIQREMSKSFSAILFFQVSCVCIVVKLDCCDENANCR